MAQYCIKGKRIINVCIPKEYYLRERLVLRVEKMHMGICMRINLNLKNVDMYQQIGFTLLVILMLLRYQLICIENVILR